MNLLVFALPEAPPDLRHTDLTRQRGEAPDLPPLHEWIGVDGIDTDKIELFPVDDVASMGLGTYLSTAYDVDADALAEAGPRIDSVKGSVLIVPEDALTGRPDPGADATLVASLPLPNARHIAAMPKADVGPQAPAPGPSGPPASRPRGVPLIVLAGLALAAILLWVLT
ncbi:hypothetical protein HKCCE3408_09895 [Rhodobacterales bacterium HKCCE3408]|nr:hypothetical protein [Rhodobacterales bacterium HKCCE3408]